MKNHAGEPLSKQLAAECAGTFCLVFAGTGAIIIDQVTGGSVTHVGIALTFGLIVLVMIYTLGEVSGAHLNPAVSLGFAVSGRLRWGKLGPFAAAQAAGALLASGVLRLLFPGAALLGATEPAGTEVQSLILEMILTGMLMTVILSVSSGAKEKGLTAGIAVGAMIGLEAMFAGPICGASMNPARSLAPALVSGHLEHLWIYLAGPLLGAVLAVPACRVVSTGGCCAPEARAA